MNSDFHSRSVSARFSAAAGAYDPAAGVQLRVALKLMDFMKDVRVPSRILEIGSGSGSLTRLVADRFPSATVRAIDVAQNSVDFVRNKFKANDKVTFVVADGMTYRSGYPYDLVVSSSTIQWIMPLDRFFRHVGGILADDGRLVFSMMVMGTLIELHEVRRRVAHNKPPMSSLPRTDRVLDALRAAGLDVENKFEEAIQADYPSVTELLYALHNTGVTGGAFSTSGAPLTRRELGMLIAEYAEQYPNQDGGVYATYRVLYVTAGRASQGGSSPDSSTHSTAPEPDDRDLCNRN